MFGRIAPTERKYILTFYDEAVALSGMYPREISVYVY